MSWKRQASSLMQMDSPRNVLFISETRQRGGELRQKRQQIFSQRAPAQHSRALVGQRTARRSSPTVAISSTFKPLSGLLVQKNFNVFQLPRHDPGAKPMAS